MAVDPLIFARAVHFAATILASGTVAFLVLVAQPAAITKMRAGFADLRRRLVILVWVALGAAIASGAIWLVLLASEILGVSIADVCLHGGAWPVIADTRFGLIWCMRLGLAVLLGLLVARASFRKIQLAVAAALAALPALIGHAGAAPGLAGNFHLASDMTHLLAAAGWLGSLPALVIVLARARRAQQPEWNDFAIVVTRRFSVLGMFTVGALLATGITNSCNLLSGPRDLMTTDYGQLVALKIGLFVSMVVIAAVNRLYLTSRLPDATASLALQCNGLAEIVLGLCVVLLVGALGTLPPAAHVHPVAAGIPQGASFAHIHDVDAMADVTVDPGRPGRVNVTVRVSREDFSRFPAKDVRLTLEPPASGSQPAKESMTEQADGTWQANSIELSQAGVWTVRVVVTTRQGKSIVLDAPIVIER
ncbi:MAG TPA: CopD family protein [Pseudolabrys sp.]|nr:CopD family protein [Pseudolabrys sp.]